MKKRIAYISLYFFTVLLIFILQKPLFMLYNGSIEKGFGFADYMQVMIHGASLDAATAGYLTAFPFLLVLISIWFRKFPLKKILYGYYILAAALISIIFVVDMALYTFWGFKLDASVFLYIDSPKEALASVSVGFILLRVLAILLLIALNSWVLLKITPSVLTATRKRIAGTAGMLLLGGVSYGKSSCSQRGIYLHLCSGGAGCSPRGSGESLLGGCTGGFGMLFYIFLPESGKNHRLGTGFRRCDAIWGRPACFR